jgi:hypothetical protein
MQSLDEEPGTQGKGREAMSRRRSSTSDVTRRGLLAGAAGLGGMSLMDLLASTALAEAGNRPSRRSSSPAPHRLAEAFKVRLKAAEHARDLGAAAQRANGDEGRFPGIACYSKTLPHDRQGRVDAKAYEVYLRALASGKPEDFERIPLGGFVKLANPQAAWAFDLLGPDSSQLHCPPAPSFGSAEQAGEMIELYWQALLRDVPFAEYGSHAFAQQAADELSALPAGAAQKREGRVTPDTLFRGSTAGDLVGPYVSQFLWKPIPFLPMKIDAKIRTAVPGLDYLMGYGEWLAIQNGALSGVNRFEATPLYIRNGRDLAEYVHRDFTYQSFLGACLIALKAGTLPDGGNPYKHSRTQGAFTTFGQPFLLYLLAVVTQAALKACWYQKWLVHRRLRPEEFAGRVEIHLNKTAEMPLHASLGLSAGLAETRKRQGTACLSQAYPEGCPAHPSYPAGHAAIAGACATVLKACFDESHVLPEPVVASPDGLSLQPWKGADLTVGGELDKLASNVALGRDFAGVHWRSDGSEGLALGEELAIRILEELSFTGNELFAGFSLRRFDGQRVAVG